MSSVISVITTETTDLLEQCFGVGIIQFGEFERRDSKGQFDPILFAPTLLPSYAVLLRRIAKQMAAMLIAAEAQGVMPATTHLLAMPNVIPLATALAMALERPLMVPSAEHSGEIDGAYDFNVPTLLVTDLWATGAPEQALIKRAKPEGLHTLGIFSLLSLPTQAAPTQAMPSSPQLSLFALSQVLEVAQAHGRISATWQQAVEHWAAERAR